MPRMHPRVSRSIVAVNKTAHVSVRSRAPRRRRGHRSTQRRQTAFKNALPAARITDDRLLRLWPRRRASR